MLHHLGLESHSLKHQGALQYLQSERHSDITLSHNSLGCVFYLVLKNLLSRQNYENWRISPIQPRNVLYLSEKSIYKDALLQNDHNCLYEDKIQNIVIYSVLR